MPQLVDATASLLRLGVGKGVIGDVEPFDVGGAGEVQNIQPFDVSAPFTGVILVDIFNISGPIGVRNFQPFDAGEVTGATSVQPFSVIATTPFPVTGVTRTSPSTSVSTVVSSPSPAGSFAVAVADTTGILAGRAIFIGMNGYLVTSVNGNTLSLSSHTEGAYQVGTPVSVPTANTVTTTPVSAGDTTLEVADVAGFTAGSTVAIRDSNGTVAYRTVLRVD
jgi:hypothetical protein